MAESQEAVCASCRAPLIIQVEPDEGEDDETEDEPIDGPSASTPQIDDDVLLQCGCHFHWQCLLDAYTLTECPNCKASLISASEDGEEQLLCNLKNEGGFQEGIDILPILTEESYLKAYPEERKCRAFLEFCAEGDTQAIIDMLRHDEEQNDHAEMEIEGASMPFDQLLRYQDQLGSFKSGLHIAVQNEKLDPAWLLLFLASNLDLSKFPPHVLAAAQGFGVVRPEQTATTDIRNLKDAEGMTAKQVAQGIGGVWDQWIIERMFG